MKGKKPMRTNLLKSFVIIVAVLLAGGATTRAETLLRNKFTPGNTRHYVMNQDQEIIVHIQGQDATQNISQNLSIEMTSKVESVDAKGNGTMSMLMGHIKMTMKGPQGVMLDYDSASQEKPKGLGKMVALLFDPLTKQPIKLTTSPLGKISNLKMPEGFSESIKKAGDAAAQVGGGMPSEEEMRDNIKEGEIVFPEAAVAEGKTWSSEDTTTIPNMGKHKFKSTFRYLGKEKKDGKDLDKISVTKELKSSGDNKDKSGLKSMTTEGTMYFDNTAGIMVETNSNSKTNIEKGPQVSLDVNVAITIKLVPGDSKADNSK
jgi:hypothetical protein